MHENQTTMFLNQDFDVKTEFLQLHAIISDRGSKYSVTAGRVESDEDVKTFIAKVKKDKKYQKASHNSYAARFVENGSIIDRKNDDGETGAGMVILRQLKKAEVVNVCVVVTRWFGGVMLYADRFKHVQDATVEIVDRLKRTN